VCAAVNGLERGGYVLWESAPVSDGSPGPELVLIATGSEVAPALQAAQALASPQGGEPHGAYPDGHTPKGADRQAGGEGTRVRVVSMPCMELFEAQDAAYRDSVIPPMVRARLAVEAGVPMSWWKWVGDDGDVVGIDRFGASAPGTTVLEEFGFTADSIASRARALLGRGG
jgi:transketolase